MKNAISLKQQMRIRELKSRTKCPHSFECCESSFQKMPRSKLIGRGKLIECFETSENCPNSLDAGVGKFCKCPLRVYAAKALGI